MYTITNSERSSAVCPQLWLLRYGLALRPKGRVRTLDVGSFVHDGLEALFDSVNSGSHSPLMNATQAIKASKEKEIERVKSDMPDGYMFDPSASYMPEDVEKIEEAATTAIRLVMAYHHHWSNDWFAIELNESTLRSAIVTPSGRASTRTCYGGKVDKVVKYGGRRFIIEHKTTSRDLSAWVELNRRSQQALGYHYLLQRNGAEVDGIIFDLIQSKPPKSWDSLTALKDGSRLSKQAGLPWVTARDFAFAVFNLHGQNDQCRLPNTGDKDADDRAYISMVVNSSKKPEAIEWYLSTYDDLMARDKSGHWFRREVVLFEKSEADRFATELYHDATRIRRWKETTKPYRDKIASADPSQLPELVESALANIGADFPRQPSVCWRYNSLCRYASLCGSHSRWDVESFSFEPAKGGHSELDESDDQVNNTVDT